MNTIKSDEKSQLLEYENLVNHIQNKAPPVVEKTNDDNKKSEIDKKYYEGKPEVDKILVFENPRAVIVKKVKLRADHNYVLIDEPLYLVRNTFWLTCDTKNVIKKYDWLTLKEKIEKCKSVSYHFTDLLRSNIGKRVRIIKKKVSCNEVIIEGTIIRVTSNFCFMKGADSKEFVFRIEDIKFIYSLEGSLEHESEKEEIKWKRKILVEYETKKDTFMYLNYAARGISWLPEYNLCLNTQSKIANLKFQATIENEMEDLVVKTLLCTGGKADLGGYGHVTLSRKRKGKKKKHSYDQGEEEDYALSNNIIIAGDYCNYEFSNINLQQNPRTIPVFDINLKYTEAYKCEIFERVSSLEVSHIIRMKNSSQHNWTPGSVIIRSDKQLFSGKSSMTSCGIAGTEEIEIEKTKSVKVSNSSSIEHTKEKKDFPDYLLIKAKVKGKVVITNCQAKNIILFVNTSFVGKFDQSDIKLQKNEEKINDDEEDDFNIVTTHLQWEIVVEKGQKKEFNFSYHKWLKQKKKLKGRRAGGGSSRYNGEYDGEDYGECEEEEE